MDILTLGKEIVSLKEVKATFNAKERKNKARVNEPSNGEGLIAKRRLEMKMTKKTTMIKLKENILEMLSML